MNNLHSQVITYNIKHNKLYLWVFRIPSKIKKKQLLWEFCKKNFCIDYSHLMHYNFTFQCYMNTQYSLINKRKKNKSIVTLPPDPFCSSRYMHVCSVLTIMVSIIDILKKIFKKKKKIQKKRKISKKKKNINKKKKY